MAYTITNIKEIYTIYDIDNNLPPFIFVLVEKQGNRLEYNHLYHKYTGITHIDGVYYYTNPLQYSDVERHSNPNKELFIRIVNKQSHYRIDKGGLSTCLTYLYKIQKNTYENNYITEFINNNNLDLFELPEPYVLK